MFFIPRTRISRLTRFARNFRCDRIHVGRMKGKTEFLGWDGSFKRDSIYEGHTNEPTKSMQLYTDRWYSPYIPHKTTWAPKWIQDQNPIPTYCMMKTLTCIYPAYDWWLCLEDAKKKFKTKTQSIILMNYIFINCVSIVCIIWEWE